MAQTPESILGRQNTNWVALAQAWDEGYDEGWGDCHEDAVASPKNPYREEN